MNIDNILSNIKDKKLSALVIGDIMRDRYYWCEANSLAQEAPIPCYKAYNTVTNYGGVRNVTKLLRNFNVPVHEVSFKTIYFPDSDGIVSMKNRVICDNRVVARFDNDHHVVLNNDIIQRGIETCVDIIENNNIGVIVISDYNKGFIGDWVANFCGMHGCGIYNGIPVIIDPHPGNCEKYNFTSKRVIAVPNKLELQQMKPHMNFSNNVNVLNLMDGYHFTDIFCTLGDEGIRYYNTDGLNYVRAPQKKASVYDVCGAGDVVVGALAMHVMNDPDFSGFEYISQMMDFANELAGISIGRVGVFIPSYNGEEK